MPVFDYNCECGKTKNDVFIRRENMEAPVLCECGKEMTRAFPQKVMLKMDGMPPYQPMPESVRRDLEGQY